MEVNEFVRAGGREGEDFPGGTNMGAALEFNEAFMDLKVALCLLDESPNPFTSPSITFSWYRCAGDRNCLSVDEKEKMKACGRVPFSPSLLRFNLLRKFSY